MADAAQTNIGIALEEYTVAVVCALPIESAAMELMLDQVYADLPDQDPSDHNSYTLGELGGHKVVIACLPAGVYGIGPAATAAN